MIPLPILAFYTATTPEALDIAVTPVSPEQQSALENQGFVFIRERHFEIDPDPLDETERSNDYVVFGWPASRSQSRIDRPSRNVKQYSFTLHTGPIAVELEGMNPASHLVLEFDPDRITVNGKPHHPPLPHGLSGGAAFHVVGSNPRLAGILTAFRRRPPRVMMAVRISEVVAIMEHAVAQS